MGRGLAKKVVKRLDRNLEGPISNFIEQFRYGHREILILYAGLQKNLAIRGSIEHGWSPFGPSAGVPKLFGKRFLHLAWSSSTMRRNGSDYSENVIAIGAPFLYLMKILEAKSDIWTKNFVNDYLFIPPHGGETEFPLLESFISEYSDNFDVKKSTALLYWTEFLNPKIRELYEQSGFTVTCSGFCGMSLNEGLGFSTRERAISGMGARSSFLLNTVRNISSHREIVAGTFGTSTLYAGYMRKAVTLLPNWNQFDSDYTNPKDKIRVSDQPFYRYLSTEVVPRHFTELLAAKDSFSNYCAEELGLADVLSPIELRSLLGGNLFTISSSRAVLDLEKEIEYLD